MSDPIEPTSAWVARYSEGYVTNDGSWVELQSRMVHEHGWEGPSEAVKVWKDRGDFNQPGVSRCGNGKQQVEDVGMVPEFKQLGVRRIVRKLTFERRRPTNAAQGSTA